MNSIRKFLEKFRQYNGFKGMIKKMILKSVGDGFEIIANQIDETNSHIDSLNKNLEKKLEEAETEAKNRIAELSEKIKMLESEIQALEPFKINFENLSINVRNNNAQLETLKSNSEMNNVKIMGIERKIENTSLNYNYNNQSIKKTSDNISEKTESAYDSVDYFDFENHFRGSIESIKKSQSYYLKYFIDKKNVIDIGCGRGEFLMLMKENNINAKGVDIYQPYVDYCSMKGLDVVCGDGIAFLESAEKADGIFAGQLIEHLQPSQIIRLCRAAYEKLEKGGCFIAETPNPTSLAIYTNAFYIDPSHIKPVHPMTMKYYLEKAGFKDIEIIFTESSRPPIEIPELKFTDSENIQDFNNAMKKVSDIMFGSQDYAVLALK